MTFTDAAGRDVVVRFRAHRSHTPPPPAPEPPDWRDEAACLGADPDLFFPGRNDWDTINAAKAMCAECPVRQTCLAEHLGELYGVFGGLTAQERRKLRNGNKRGTCAACGGWFWFPVRRGPNRRYCGDECRGRARTESQRAYERRNGITPGESA